MFTSYSRSQIFCNRSLIRERFGNDINCTPGSRFFFFLTPVNAMVLLAQRGIVHNLYAITCSPFLLRMRGITNLVPLLGGIHAHAQPSPPHSLSLVPYPNIAAESENRHRGSKKSCPMAGLSVLLAVLPLVLIVMCH